MTSRRTSALLIFVLISGSLAGCRNQCGSGPGFRWRPFAQKTVIPPPATYSLNIPGTNGAYYNPNATAANPGAAAQSPSAAAPTNNWYPAGTSNQGVPLGNNQPQSGNPFQLPQQNGQLATATTFQQGSSQVISPDFYTTRVDERRDASRLPMTDASNVRAPSPLQNLYPLRTAQNQNAGPGFQGVLTSAAPGQFQNLYPNQMTNSNQFANNPATTVLARSSTAPEYNPNYQNGWRSSSTMNPPVINR